MITFEYVALIFYSAAACGAIGISSDRA